MAKKDKSIASTKRRPHIVPTEQSTEPRVLAKQPVEQRGGSARRIRKGARKESGR